MQWPSESAQPQRGARRAVSRRETGKCALTDLTHLGFWDIPMITSIPEIVYLAPTNVEEYFAMMDWASNC